jgi:hypothetical protein
MGELLVTPLDKPRLILGALQVFIGEKKLRAPQVVSKGSVYTILGAYVQYYYILGKRVQVCVLGYCPLGQGLLSVRMGGPLLYVLTKDEHTFDGTPTYVFTKRQECTYCSIRRTYNQKRLGFGFCFKRLKGLSYLLGFRTFVIKPYFMKSLTTFLIL